MCCLETKKGDRKKGERQGEGEGWAALCLKTREKGGRRKRGADRQERRFRGGGEGRLAGWRLGWVVSVESRAGLYKASFSSYNRKL